MIYFAGQAGQQWDITGEIMFFSARSGEFFYDPNLYGIMLSYRATGGQQLALEHGCLWMLDNGAFSGHFRENRWQRQMERLAPFAAQCRGVIAPDAVVLNDAGEFLRGDWRGTLEKLHYYSPIIRLHGLPVAYALQDDHPADMIPWHLFDVLFVAGVAQWKTSIEVERIARHARGLGVRVHIGRVSTVERLTSTWWADSWDGTTFKWEPGVKRERFGRVIPALASRAHQWKLI